MTIYEWSAWIREVRIKFMIHTVYKWCGTSDKQCYIDKVQDCLYEGWSFIPYRTSLVCGSLCPNGSKRIQQVSVLVYMLKGKEKQTVLFYSWVLMTCCTVVKHSGRSYNEVNANRGRSKVVPVLAMHLEMVVLNYPLVQCRVLWYLQQYSVASPKVFVNCLQDEQ